MFQSIPVASVAPAASVASAGSVSPLRVSTRGLRAAGRRGIKTLAEAVLPSSVIVWRGPEAREPGPRPGKGRIALTFDDGPDELTEGYLTALDGFGARATFFVVGELCAAHPDLVSRIAARGHELAGHGYTHRRFPTLSAAELRDELVRTAALLPPPSVGRRPLVRPPHGAVSVASILTCARAGFTTALWSHDSGDWCTERPEDVLAAFEQEEASRSGAIVLLHEGQTWTLEALPRILGRLKEAGHELVTVGELLGGSVP
jgi:peptidoglycan/xylan/chitin deacetylase (PgdA/CDA1 family)